MRRIAHMLCVAALATPASADECRDFRDALAVLDATAAIASATAEMRIVELDVFHGGRAAEAAGTAVDRADRDAALALAAARASVDEAAGAAVRARDADLSAEHRAALEAAANARPAPQRAWHDVEEATRTGATASRHYFRAGEAVVALDNAYHDLVMAIACR